MPRKFVAGAIARQLIQHRLHLPGQFVHALNNRSIGIKLGIFRGRQRLLRQNLVIGGHRFIGGTQSGHRCDRSKRGRE